MESALRAAPQLLAQHFCAHSTIDWSACGGISGVNTQDIDIGKVAASLISRQFLNTYGISYPVEHPVIWDALKSGSQAGLFVSLQPITFIDPQTSIGSSPPSPVPGLTGLDGQEPLPDIALGPTIEVRVHFSELDPPVTWAFISEVVLAPDFGVVGERWLPGMPGGQMVIPLAENVASNMFAVLPTSNQEVVPLHAHPDPLFPMVGVATVPVQAHTGQAFIVETDGQGNPLRTVPIFPGYGISQPGGPELLFRYLWYPVPPIRERGASTPAPSSRAPGRPGSRWAPPGPRRQGECAMAR